MMEKNKHKRKTPYAPDSSEANGFLASAYGLGHLTGRYTLGPKRYTQAL